MALVGSYGLCQTACNAGAVACYASFGFVFGTVTAGAGVPAAVVGCNTAQGACMSVCSAKFLIEAVAETAATGGLALPVLASGGLAVVFFSNRRKPDDPSTNSKNS
jgi:hypothetical protein